MAHGPGPGSPLPQWIGHVSVCLMLPVMLKPTTTLREQGAVLAFASGICPDARLARTVVAFLFPLDRMAT